MKEKLKKLRKNKATVTGIMFLGLIVLFAGISAYGYYVINVTGNNTAKGVEVTTANLSIVYTNSNEIKMENILPGVSQTKTFTVENTGNVTAHYNLVWKNLTNEFDRQTDLVYSITSTNNGGTLSEKSVPISGGHRGIITYISIPADTTQTYTLTVKYKNVDEMQNADEGKDITGKIEVEEIPWTEETDESCFTFSSGTITDYDNTCPKSVNIPSTIGGVTVETIGNGAFNGNSLKSVIIPNTVTSIGANAFLNNSLTTITIPSSVTLISNYAFRVNSLTKITLPDKYLNMVGSFGANQLPDADAFIYKRNSNGTYDKTYLLSYAGAKRSAIVIPSSIKTLGNVSVYATGITSITIPGTVETIGNGAFQWNSSLTSVTISSGVETIGNYAFDHCNLTTVTIPSTVQSIGNYAFYKTATYNKNLTTILNQTGTNFDWGLIVNGTSGYDFVSGTVVNSAGDVTVEYPELQ